MTHVEASALVGSLFSCWYSSLVRYASRHTGSVDAAEDLVQEVFMRLYRELRRSKTIRDPRSWTLSVLRHEIGKVARSQQCEHARQAPVEALDRVPASHADDDTRGAGADDLTSLLAILTPREEEVILLRMTSMKYREIGERLGISASSVNTLLARALRKLQQAAKGNPGEFSARAPVEKRVRKPLQ